MWDLIVSVPDHCLSFYFVLEDTDSGRSLMKIKNSSGPSTVP